MIKQNEQKSGINPTVAAVTVALVGAGIAVAGAVALKDKKNRDKVKNVLINVRDRAAQHMEDMQKQAKDKIGKTKKKLAQELKK